MAGWMQLRTQIAPTQSLKHFFNSCSLIPHSCSCTLAAARRHSGLVFSPFLCPCPPLLSLCLVSFLCLQLFVHDLSPAHRRYCRRRCSSWTPNRCRQARVVCGICNRLCCSSSPFLHCPPRRMTTECAWRKLGREMRVDGGSLRDLRTRVLLRRGSGSRGSA